MCLLVVFACVVQGKFGPVHGDLPGRSGAIQAAIHLELPSAEISHVNVLIGKLKNICDHIREKQPFSEKINYNLHAERVVRA